MTAARNLSVAPSSAAERWRGLPLRWKAVLVLGSSALLVELVISTVGGIYNPSPAPITGSGSSYDSSGAGSAALAQLLRQQGHTVTGLTTPLAQASGSLAPGSAVFVLDPHGNAGSDAEAIRHLLADGDEVVLAGEPAPGVLATLFAGQAQPRWNPAPSGTAHPTATAHAAPGASAPELYGVSQVVGGGGGSWSAPGAARPLLTGPDGTMALLDAAGSGRLVLLASTDPLQNANLGRADNAAFALDLTGGAHSTRPVAFDEYDHGFGHEQAGLSGLPGHWKAGLLIAILAAVLAMVGAGRRFGPPTPAERDLIPPRAAHVDAMATLLASGSPERLAEAAAPVRIAAAEELRRRLRLAPDASPAECSAALGAGESSSGTTVPEWIAETVLERAATAGARAPIHPDELVRLGRASALLRREGQSR